MFTAIFTAMLPQSVTQKGLAWTQAAREAPTYFRARVVSACGRVADRVEDASWNFYRRVNGASYRVADALVGAITPVHEQMERVHLDVTDRAYRVKHTRDNEIMAVVERSPTVKALCDRVETLNVVCLVLVVCNALLLFKLIFC